MAGEELDDCHLIHLSYMADGPDDTPIAVRAACKLCGQAWEFVGTTEDVKDYDRQLTAANERAERYKAALEEIVARRGMTSLYGWEQDVAYEALNPTPTSDTEEISE